MGMLRIGDFSSLAQVSIKTLRHYDQLGLLPPASIDSATGYRYYTARQLSRLHCILALKDLGFTLEQIAQALDRNLAAPEMRQMLALRQQELAHHLETEADRLSRINSRLRLIEQENEMNYDVIVKTEQPQWLASVREKIAAYPAVCHLYGKVAAGLGPYMADCSHAVALWHDPEYRESDVDAEAGFFLPRKVPAAAGVRVYETPRVTVASAIHNGAYRRLPEAYDALLRWVAENGYQVAGPIRELYLQATQSGSQDDESCVTEIQVPVSKNSELKN